MKCQLCGSELELLGQDHLGCKNCGLGQKGKPDLKDHLKFLQNTIILAKALRPDLNDKELTDFVQNTLHKVENHPLDKHDFCIYCNKSFRQTQSL